MIKSAKKSDVRILAELEMLMWEDNTVMNLSKEFEELISNEKTVCFIKYVNGEAIGFAQ